MNWIHPTRFWFLSLCTVGVPGKLRRVYLGDTPKLFLGFPHLHGAITPQDFTFIKFDLSLDTPQTCEESAINSSLPVCIIENRLFSSNVFRSLSSLFCWSSSLNRHFTKWIHSLNLYNNEPNNKSVRQWTHSNNA